MWLRDTAERTLRTFVQGFLAVVTLDQFSTSINLSTLDAIYTGLAAGAYAVLTSFAAKGVGSPDSASFKG